MLNFIPTPVAQSLAHGHDTDTTVGYVVRRTFFAGDRVHEDAGRFTDYSAALERAREVRAEGHDGYAVVDRMYACGCRGMG